MSLSEVTFMDVEGSALLTKLNGEISMLYQVTIEGYPPPGGLCNVPTIKTLMMKNGKVKVTLNKTFDPYSASYRDLLDAINQDQENPA